MFEYLGQAYSQLILQFALSLLKLFIFDRPCPCPNSIASGHSFAAICELDQSTNEPVCDCDIGYNAPTCSVCADNYFGRPEQPGGSCQVCTVVVI